MVIVFLIPIVFIILIVCALASNAKDESAKNDLESHLNEIKFEYAKKYSFKKDGNYVLFACDKDNSEIVVIERVFGELHELDRINYKYDMFYSNLEFIEYSDIKRIVLLINKELKQILYISYEDSLKKGYLDWSDILSVELMSKIKSVTNTSTSSTVGRAVIGGLVSGGVGAIIGGATASSTSINVEDCYGIRINTRLLDMPYMELRLKDYMKDNDYVYKSKVEKEIRDIYSILSIIIDSERNK
jgi:hypothetical protein